MMFLFDFKTKIVIHSTMLKLLVWRKKCEHFRVNPVKSHRINSCILKCQCPCASTKYRKYIFELKNTFSVNINTKSLTY